MGRSPDAPTRGRRDAYFTASFEVAKRLSEGRGEEAIDVLARELERVRESGDASGSSRFLLSQIALCQARMGQNEAAGHSLEELEEELPKEPETALILAEGWLLLLDKSERAAEHAATALRWAEDEGENSLEFVARARNLLARALLAGGDLVGAFAAWESCPLPAWRVGVSLIEAGYDTAEVRRVLESSLPQHVAYEQEQGAAAVASADRVRRLISWIDAGCPRSPSA